MGNDVSYQPENFKFSNECKITGIYPSPDNKFIALGVEREEIRIIQWNGITFETKSKFQGCVSKTFISNQIPPAFSYDNKFFVYRWEKEARIFNLETMQ